MAALESMVIFSQVFPKATPAAMMEEAVEIFQAMPEKEKSSIPTCKEMLNRIHETYTYQPRPDAEQMSNQFISYAIEVCREFEIDTMIVREKHAIVVSMDLYYSWYGGPVKHALERLLIFCDDFTLTSTEDKPDCIRVSMAYYTHEIFRNGKRVELY